MATTTVGCAIVVKRHILPTFRCVAIRTLPIIVAIWRRMTLVADCVAGVIKVDRCPIFSNVAIGALPIIMIGRRCVARSAVYQPVVTEDNGCPILRGNVAVGALPRVMAGGWDVARGAIHQPIMAKADQRPGVGADVAVGALANVVASRRFVGVTGDTVGQPVVQNLLPVFRDVAVGALPAVVAWWPAMTRFAVCIGYVVKVDFTPVCYCVAA